MMLDVFMVHSCLFTYSTPVCVCVLFSLCRKQCKFSHDVRSEHNYTLLRECTLHELHEDDLFLLLLQNDPTLLPEVKHIRTETNTQRIYSTGLSTTD